ncbi:MAG: FAD-binding and (Fe-S)-binding domain-containing protein [Anaerolineaceae bacterium]|nr:FAD-binding and (Fe-S)-binding domain-containing protein [Anaerolineaceae bacterium]
MEPQLQESLLSVLPRVNTDRVERKLYGHDVGAMPGMVKPLIGSTLPDAVAQPQTEEELVALVRWAGQHHVPLTPRGKATSGYGGVLPVKQGVVVDFYALKDVLALDTVAQTVTVQPGITWEQLDRYLQAHAMTLRLYPSSYPSSTVGGWLAQGGAGYGSYEFGTFAQNVISARLVLPGGEVRTFQGPELELVSDAEGITGLISQVTLRIQPNEPLDVISIGVSNPVTFQAMIESLVAADLPIWSMMFINPKMAELKNLSPQQEHLGHPVGHKVDLPAEFILTLAVRASHSQQVRAALPELLSAYPVRVLDERIARHEWETRFKLMQVKRLGPSLVPTEVVVPLENLGRVLEQISKKIGQPLVKEGVVLRSGANGKPEVVILGFIPSDQRKWSYNFVFALALTVIRIAEQNGGRAYSTGLYFANKANRVLGKARLERIKAFKQQVDPAGIMNPGKVISGSALGTFMQLAGAFEPLARLFGNAVEVEVGERPTQDVRGIPADVVWYAYACSQCGYCVDECDQFYGRGWESQSPRGKWYWLREYLEGREEWDQQAVDTFLVCTTCELCNDRCSAALPIEPSWMKLRGRLIHEDRRMTFPPFEMMAAAVTAEGDIWAGYRKDRDNWFPAELKDKHGPEHKAKAVYFAGCTASYVENDIGIASVKLLDAAGVDFTYLGQAENCCGTPMLVAGKWDVFVEIMQRNLAAVKAAGADTVISSCPACDMMWRHVYPTWAEKLGIPYEIEARHYSEVVTEQIRAGEFQFPANDLPQQTVTWHDSCHIGRVSGVYEPPRDLIKAIPNVNLVEMSHNRQQAHCCGSVLTLIKEPDVAAGIGENRLDEAVEAGAQKVLALCPCCEFQLRVSADKRQVPVEVVDLAAFAAQALGYQLPDPHPEVKAQWAVFEAMIALMTPQGFADLMGTMWPELIDARPLGMGGMMRFMGKNLPGTLDLMKPMFPLLFPRLLPLMMPKVMPVMLERVAGQVPMPDYMAAQMPDLMPKVMDNLMPHMIGDVVPLVTDPMLGYLKHPDGRLN